MRASHCRRFDGSPLVWFAKYTDGKPYRYQRGLGKAFADAIRHSLDFQLDARLWVEHRLSVPFSEAPDCANSRGFSVSTKGDLVCLAL